MESTREPRSGQTDFDIIHFEALGPEASYLDRRAEGPSGWDAPRAPRLSHHPAERPGIPEGTRGVPSAGHHHDQDTLRPSEEHYLSGGRKSIITRSAGYDHFEHLTREGDLASLRKYCVNAVAQTAMKFLYAAAGMLNHYTRNAATFERKNSVRTLGLKKQLRNVADKAGLPMPKLAIVPNNTPNAFTFGRSQSSATLAVHEGLLRTLKEDEIRGVIAHELGHIKHKDYIVMTVLSALPLIAYIIAEVALISGAFSGGSSGGGRGNKNNNSGAILILIGIISFVIYILTFLIVMRLSRLREHFADSFSAYVTGSPRELESALAKITYGLSISPKPPEGSERSILQIQRRRNRKLKKSWRKKTTTT